MLFWLRLRVWILGNADKMHIDLFSYKIYDIFYLINRKWYKYGHDIFGYKLNWEMKIYNTITTLCILEFSVHSTETLY